MIHVENRSQLELPIEGDYTVDIEEDDSQDDVIEQDDGSAIVTDLEDPEAPQNFDDNLAEQINLHELNELARDLLESIDLDKEAREKRDKQYEEGLRRTGLGDDAPGGADFQGASRVVHPVMAEACVDFASRAIKELFPAGGPAKMEDESIVGDPKQEEIIKNTAKFLNHQFTKDIAEYRGELEKELTQLPLGGSQFMKLYYSSTKDRICAEFISIDNIFIPYYATNFYDAERVTHRQYPDRQLFEQRIKSGEYIDINLVSVGMDPEISATGKANEKIEGKESTGFNEDGVRTVYEVYTWATFEGDQFSQGERAPYIITLDEYDQKVISVRRNWEQNDPLMQKLDWIVEDVFIYWMGAYGIGLPHLIGGLSAAATGSLRALLDSAHINNAPTALKLKGAKISGQNQQVNVTQISDIEGPVGIDDIRKYIMPMPFNQPSAVLFQLLGWLTDAAKGVVSTASEKIADATSNTPVGTVQALIEQGAVIFSSIHSRLHFSQAKKFEIVLRLAKTYGAHKLAEFGLDPQSVSLKGVTPVSDPRIFSEAQRFAQMQGVIQLAGSDPTVPYNKIELHRSMLALMKVGNIDRLLPVPPQPQPADPAQELISMISGKPVVVATEQDHMSHIIAHVNYLKDPLCGMNPIMVVITMKVLDHLREHIAMFFASRMLQAAPQPAQAQMGIPQQGPQPLPGPMGVVGRPGMPPQMPQPPEKAMAQASIQIIQQDMQIAQEALEAIKAVDQFVKDNLPPTPDTMAVKMQADVAKMEIQRKAEADAQNLQLKQAAEEFKRQQEALLLKFEADKAEKEREYQRISDSMKQHVDLMKNDADNRQKQLTELLKNADDNRTTIIVEKIKALLASQQDKETPEPIQQNQIDKLTE